MSKKVETAEQMSELLKGVATNLESDYLGAFPTLRGLINQINRKAEALVKPEAERAGKPVSITYSDGEIQVTGLRTAGVNFWRLKYGLDAVMGEDTGKTVDKPDSPYHGNPIYKSSYDRTRKCNVLPADKKDAVLAFFQAEGVAVEETAA